MWTLVFASSFPKTRLNSLLYDLMELSVKRIYGRPFSTINYLLHYKHFNEFFY
jgi:hypothetical protein